jgi:hypothetical protein
MSYLGSYFTLVAMFMLVLSPLLIPAAITGLHACTGAWRGALPTRRRGALPIRTIAGRAIPATA